MNCCLFTNNILNPFTPFGDGSLMRIANMYANVAQRGTREELIECFAMMIDRPAKFLRREDYGVAVGNASDLVVWDATTADEAVSINAEARFGFKSGRRTFARPAVELHCPS